MRGKNHLISGLIFLIIIFLADLFTGLNLYSIINKTNFAIVLFIIYLFFAGLLLPDADKFGSWIFKFFLPFAIISWLIGFLVSAIKGKKFRHRGFLHSYLGIFITSFSSSIVVFLTLSLFIEVTFIFFFVFFTSTLLGQIIHLMFD